MTMIDVIGWCAVAATLLTFSMRSMTRLRTVAIVSNVCFMAYGAAAELLPIFALHLVLLPFNVVRLRECRALRRRDPTAEVRPPRDAARD